MPKVLVTVRVAPELREQLNEVAYQQRTSQQQLCKKLIEKAVADYQRERLSLVKTV